MNDYTEFYLTYRERIFSYLMRMTGDQDLSSDLMQESFTRYFEKYGTVPQNSALLFTIARNAVFDHSRKARHETYFRTIHKMNPVDQERNVAVRAEYRRMLTGLGKLAPHERDVLALVATGELTYREIADISGMSESNVKVKVHRARLKLRKILEEEES
jgi:RNA polymerase sigma-70 factor (ECF subfamily)